MTLAAARVAQEPRRNVSGRPRTGMMMLRIERWDVRRDGPLNETALRQKLGALGYEAAPRPSTRWTAPVTARGDVAERVEAVVSGLIKVTIDGESAILTAGDVVFVPRGSVRRVEEVGTSAGVRPAAVYRTHRHLTSPRGHFGSSRTAVHSRQNPPPRVPARAVGWSAMIDRRRFVQSMIALGAAAGVRPATMLFGSPAAGELRDLADAGLSAAKTAGASYADIRINRYRNQFIFTRDRRVQNIVNTEDYGFGIRVIVDGTWGFASSSAVTKEEIARVAAQAAAIARANRKVNAEPVRLSPVESYDTSWNTPVKKNPFEMPLQPKLDLLLQINDEALKVHGRELRLRLDAVRERAEVFRVERGVAHRAVAHPFLSVLLDHGGRPDEREVLFPQRAHRADGHGLRVRRVLSAARRGARRGRGSGRDAQGQAGRRRAEDAHPAPDESVADDPRVGRPSDGARSRARLRGELRGHELPHHRQARQVRVRLEDGQHPRRQDAAGRAWRRAATTTTGSRRPSSPSSRTACSSTTRRRATRRT